MANDDILISISEEPDATLHILGEYIGSAYSPQIEVTETQTGHDVAITYDDAEDGITTTTFSVEDGEDGADGFSPTLLSSAITGGHRVSMTDATGTKTFDVMDGLDGADGYSPSAKVMQGDGSVTITITDKDGTTTAAVHDGADGTDGFSPTATVTQTASGATISITDKSGTTTASVSNGTDGTDGTDGADGFSPTVDVQEITGGHEVTITDADGAHSFDVMDGSGADVPEDLTDKVDHLWGNRLIGSMGGTVASVDDAYAANPETLDVYGASTQAGTPTPDAPVPILSVDDLSLWLASQAPTFLNSSADWMQGTIRTADGTTNSAPNRIRSVVLTIEVGKTYSIQCNSGFECSLRGYSSEPVGAATYVPDDTTDFAQSHTLTSSLSTRLRLVLRRSDDSRITPENASELNVFVAGSATAIHDLLPEGTVLRSLPDGTKDTLSLSYLRPSTREGWAVYQAILTALVGMTTTAATDGITGTVGVDVMSTTGEIANGPTVLFKLATPVTTALDPIELPQLPAPNATVWCDGGSATPTMQMQYVRDTNLVIQAFEAALADLATS